MKSSFLRHLFSLLGSCVLLVGLLPATVLAAPSHPVDPTVPCVGDESHLVLWVVLLVVACAGIIGLLLYNKTHPSGKGK